jgi:ABC-type Fe3+ transport system permease subunit
VYQPYPGGQAPAPQVRRVPVALRNAVWLMYAGAAVSLIRVIVNLATESSTRSAMLSALKNGARESGVNATPSEFNTGITTTMVLAAAAGLVGVGLWILTARASQNGSGSVRSTGSVFFGLYTVALLAGPPDIGLRGPGDDLSKIVAGIIWLVGLGTVVLLWRKDSGAFFKARPQRSPGT